MQTIKRSTEASHAHDAHWGAKSPLQNAPVWRLAVGGHLELLGEPCLCSYFLLCLPEQLTGCLENPVNRICAGISRATERRSMSAVLVLLPFKERVACSFSWVHSVPMLTTAMLKVKTADVLA